MKKIKDLFSKLPTWCMIAIFSILGLAFIPPLINWIVTFENPLGFGFIIEANRGDWINFYGAIIGGGVTLGGVYWTIQYEKKMRIEDKDELEDQRKENLAIEYRPILISIDTISIKFNKKSNNLEVEGVLKNIGRGEATNIHIRVKDKKDFITYFLRKDEEMAFNATLALETQFNVNVDQLSIEYKDLQSYKQFYAVFNLENQDIHNYNDYDFIKYVQGENGKLTLLKEFIDIKKTP